MPYTPDYTDVANPPDTGVLAATAAAEFRNVKVGIATKVPTNGALGTPTSGILTNCTGLPLATGISGLAAGVALLLATFSSANLAGALTDETGTGGAVFANTPTLIAPLLGTPTSGVLTNCTGLPIASGVSGLAAGAATFLTTPSSANLRSLLTDESGTGALLFAGGALGTIASGDLAAGTNAVAYGIKTATTTVSVSAATAPTNGQVLTASSTTLATWVTPGGGTLDGVTAAVGNSSINNAANNIVWNWQLTAASEVGFTFTENSASTGGGGSQAILEVATLAASTANPFRVKTRTNTTFEISSVGVVTLEAGYGTAIATGSSINILAGPGAATSGGNITLTGGVASSGTGGALTLTSGAATSSGTSGGITLLTGQGGNNTGAISITTGAGAFNSGNITVGTGQATTGNASGTLTLRTGNSTLGTGGDVIIIAGARTVTAGAPITLTAGNGGAATVPGGSITITSGNGNTTGLGGNINVTAGNGGASNVGGDIVLTAGTGTGNGYLNFVNLNAANAAVAVTITSVGPTGAATTIQGWLRIKVGGTARFVPYW